MQRLGTARFVVVELPSDVKRSDQEHRLYRIATCFHYLRIRRHCRRFLKRMFSSSSSLRMMMLLYFLAAPVQQAPFFQLPLHSSHPWIPSTRPDFANLSPSLLALSSLSQNRSKSSLFSSPLKEIFPPLLPLLLPQTLTKLPQTHVSPSLNSFNPTTTTS
jgi:hypothetical protein